MLCGCMIEVSCLYCVAVWLKYPVCILWLYGWGNLYYIVWMYGWVTLFVLCGWKGKVSCLHCFAVWLRYPVCVVWLHVWGVLFVLCGCVVEVPFFIIWLYCWGTLCVLCGCMVEVSCLYCVAVWLKYPFLLYGCMVEVPFLVLCGCMVEIPFFVLCGSVVEVCCVLSGCMLEVPFLYCVALWMRCAVCTVWLYGWSILFVLCGCYVLRYLDFRAQTIFCNRVVFLCEASQAVVGITVYSGLCLFLYPFQLSSHYSLSYFSFNTNNFLRWCHVSQVYRPGNEGLCKYGVTILFFYPNFTAPCW